MGKRQIAAQQTRLKLIQAAKKLIEERGFDEVKIEDISKEAGVAKGSFYTYFKKKEDVLAAVSEEIFSPIKNHSLLLEGSILQRIKTFLQDSVISIKDTGINNCKIWLSTVVKELDEKNVMGTGKLYFDLNTLKEILMSGSADLSNRDIDVLSQTILAEYYGALTLWCITNGALDPLTTIEDYCESELRSLLKTKYDL